MSRLLEKQDRVDRVNALVVVIAACGRQFFQHKNRVARMEIDERGCLWWTDQYSGVRIYTHKEGRWRGFTNGGTLKSLVEALRDYVRTGEPLGPYFGPWPHRVGGGDLWGYGEEAMERVRNAAALLEITRSDEPSLAGGA